MPPKPFGRNSLLASEILQQPTLWPTTVERVRSAGFAASMAGLPVLFTGAGTSAYAGAAIAEAWPHAQVAPTTDLLLQSKSEILSAVPSLGEGGWLVSLARSGDSPESTAVVEKMQKLFPSVRHLAIVCNEAGRLAHTAGVEVLLLDPRTNDRSLAMTGSFSNLVLAGLCLIHGDRLAEAVSAICSNVESGQHHVEQTVADIASTCEDRVVILSSTMQALSREAALKIVELTDGRVLAMAETFLAFRHGPVGFLRENTPVVCFLSSDAHKRLYEMDLIDDLRGRGLGRLILVGDHALSKTERDWLIPAAAPSLPDAVRTPFEVVFAQMLAFYLSMNAQVDPDDPSPGGAITRVVRPFRIHAA